MPLGDPDLGLHDVDAGDHLGDRVLHLDAGVHLDEVEVRPSCVQQELDRAGVDVADGAGERDGRLAQPRPQGGVERNGAGAISITFWWRRCTEQSRSNRWTTFAVRVAQDLDLDVARPDQELLQEEVALPEGGLGLAAWPLRTARAAPARRGRPACRARRRRRRPSG